MAKKKSKQASGEDGDDIATGSLPSPPSSVVSRANKVPKVAAPPASPSLIICRNKHWRYISCFHGPWLQMPIEILETVANINYNAPRPRPIDPAVFFDLVKVRRLVDEASNLAVRAASDIASPTLTNVNGGMPGSSPMNAFGIGGHGHGAKLSRERKFRMREQASQKLSRAYRLDEIACSVATMQGASPLEEVGYLVLQRSPKDPDAKYVHFFHEKIPSRQLAESTSLEPLGDIIAERPNEPEVFRTRATVKSFKADYDGAVADLTHALALCRYHNVSHDPGQTPEEGGAQLQDPSRRRRPQEVKLAEKDQPSSLEGQIYFQRATVYLAMASSHVPHSLPAVSKIEDGGSDRSKDETASVEDPCLAEQQAESRKMVKTFAKRAIKDYMSFLSQFDYSPNLPNRAVREFNLRVSLAAHGNRSRHTSDSNPPPEPHTVYSLGELFSAVPPSDLPPYPSQDVAKRDVALTPEALADMKTESVTYHPLLTDALHSLLLCHCLAQTSAKELQRHSYMVARIVRLTDGYPVFQASRSPARSDWIEVIRRVTDFIQLEGTWDSLCTPSPLPMYDQKAQQHKATPSLGARAATAAANLLTGTPMNGNTQDAAAPIDARRRDRMRQQAIIDALNDERVVDEATFRASVKAREKRAREEMASAGTPDPNAPPSNVVERNVVRRWSPEDGREYPILTERAAAIAQWVREAPTVPSTAKRKKRPKKSGDPKLQGADEGMSKLELDEPADAQGG